MSRIRIQLDEDCQAHALATALRQHGIDAQTTNQLGLAGVDDEAQLKAAAGADRVLVTNNISDFVPLHQQWLADGRLHGGVIVFLNRSFRSGRQFVDGPINPHPQRRGYAKSPRMAE